MKKVIKGKMCNTNTAILYGWKNGLSLYERPNRDMYFVEANGELLYCSEGSASNIKKSEYFIWK